MKENKILFLKRMSLFILLIFMVSKTQAFAVVTEGQKGQTYTGEYVVIVNTNPSEKQSTGTLVFSNQEAQATAKVSDVSDAGIQPVGEDLLEETAANLFSLNVASDTAESYLPGQQKSFFCYGGAKMFTCIKVGQNCYIWMENSMKTAYENEGKLSLIANEAAEIYDGQSFAVLNAMCGGEFGYRDNSGKLSIALEAIAGGGTSGVYMGKYNEPDITAIHINIPAASSYHSGSLNTGGLLVHEGQHALFEQRTDYYPYGRYMWLNEGLSVAAMEYFWGGSDSSQWLSYIAGNSSVRNGSALIYNSYRSEAARDYAMPYLFVRYLTNRLQGSYDLMGLFQKIYAQSGAGIDSSEFVKKVSGISFSELLTDFYTAIAAGEATGKYGFQGDILAQKAANGYPCYLGASGSSVSLEGTAAIILHLTEGSSFTVPEDCGKDVQYRIVGKKTQVVSPAQGKGTAAEPYLITSAKEWNLIGNNTGACYKLVNDISFAGVSQITFEDFYGSLDGAGYTVAGLTGPIAGTNHGTIKNIKLKVNISGAASDYQGAVVKVNQKNIDNCVVSGTITLSLTSRYALLGTAYGVIAGENMVSGTISNCVSFAEVTISSKAAMARIGGITGINSGSVKKCINKGNLSVQQQSGTIYAGGITGETNRDANLGGLLEQCLNYGSITAVGAEVSYTGQICGFAAQNIIDRGIENYIKNCYGKAGAAPLIGSPEQNTVGNSRLLTDEEAKSEDSYQGLDFNADWKIGEDGLQLRDGSDIISIEAQYYQKECFVGEKIEYFSTSKPWGQLQVNGDSYVPITDDMVSGFDSSKPGETTVMVSYKGLTTSYTIQVVEPTRITSLVYSSASHTKYNAGDFFETDGIVLYGTIDGRIAYISGGLTCDEMPLQAGQTSATVNYFGTSVEIPITVTDVTLANLNVSGKLERTQYTAGDSLDLSSIQVQLIYNNGSKTEMIGVSEFAKYEIGIALKDNNNSVTAISMDTKLSVTDNGKTVYLYRNSLPGQSGSISIPIGVISVYEPLMVESNDAYVIRGQESYAYSYVSGGSGSYSTEVIGENLPAGIHRDQIPSDIMGVFIYSGTTMADSGNYKCIYSLRDTQTGNVILVDIIVHVQESNIAQMTEFNLLRSQNSGLTVDVTGIIEEGKITLKVPSGTDISNLMPSIQFTPYPGADCNYYNGRKFDFSKPVTYVLTAPDGKTTISYDIVIEYIETEPQTEKETEPQTEKETEAPTEKETEPQTEKETQPQTEKETQPQTEKETQPQTEKETQPQTEKETQPQTEKETQPQTEKETEVHIHTQGGWVITKAPSVFENGEKKLKCAVCGKYMSTQTIPQLKAEVTLNAYTLPLQVKKSTTALKIISKDSKDSVLSWSSSNTNVLTVDARTGKISAKKLGTTYVTVKMRSGASARCLIKVQKKKVTTQKVTVSRNTIILKQGEKFALSAQVTPLTSSDKVKFSSSKKKIAAVNSKGVITAKKKGSAVITVKSGRKKAKVKITVK